MAKTPPYLKGLAETRARAAGDVVRFGALAGDALASLAEEKLEVTLYQSLADEFNARLTQAHAEANACDIFIRKIAPNTDPANILAIQAWQGHYGRRGSLKAAIADCIRSSAPAAVSKAEIVLHVQAEWFTSRLAVTRSRATSTPQT